MQRMALPGVGALQDSLAETNQLLAETNRLLAQVLAELKSTNGERLADLTSELQRLSRHLGAGGDAGA
jgi:hypothetical protein